MMTLNNFKNKLLHFLQLQLFINLISMPILMCWGLPISYMSIVGNFLFSPALTLFLFLSTLIFFTELFCLPNTFLIIPLEWFTQCWSYVLSYGSRTWLLTFARPSLFVLFLIPVLALAIIHHKKLSLGGRCLALALLTCASSSYLIFARPAQRTSSVACVRGAVIIARCNGKTLLIDPGCIATNASISSWVNYTLAKELIKHYGTTHIDHCIFLQPSNRVFEAITALQEVATLGSVYLPYWQGSLKKNDWKKFFTMRTALQKNNVTFVRLAEPRSISLGEQNHLTITRGTKTIRSATICYPALQVRGNVGSDILDVVSVKAEPKEKKGVLRVLTKEKLD